MGIVEGMLLVAGLLALFVAVGVLGYLITIYNGLVQLRNNIDKSWSNIDVLLKQRHDELPKLLETVKGYMKHEKTLLENITKARSIYSSAQSVHDKAVADSMLTGALKSLFAVAENYPDLKANQSFLGLQGRITGLENEIADRREFYNDSVNSYNVRIESIPDVLVARMLGYPRKELFQVTEGDREDVEIKF